MGLSVRIPIIAVAAAFVAVTAPAIGAQNGNGPSMRTLPASRAFTGNSPAMVSKTQFNNGAYCLTLSGARNSGSASLVFGSRKFQYGSFVIVNGELVVTITEQLGSQNGALMFIAPVNGKQIGAGVFEAVAGGANFDSGDLVLGKKGSC